MQQQSAFAQGLLGEDLRRARHEGFGTGGIADEFDPGPQQRILPGQAGLGEAGAAGIELTVGQVVIGLTPPQRQCGTQMLDRFGEEFLCEEFLAGAQGSVEAHLIDRLRIDIEAVSIAD